MPGDASGGLDGVQLRALTTDFHEPGFVATLNGENALGFWFQLSDDDRRQAGVPWGPANPQALNRYSYVLNAPVKATDPSGHSASIDLDSNSTDQFNRTQSQRFKNDLDTQVNNIWNVGITIGVIGAGFAGAAAVFLAVPPLTAAGGAIGGVALAVITASVVKEGQRVSGMISDAQGFLDKNGGGKMSISVNDDGSVIVEAFSNQPNTNGKNYVRLTTNVNGWSRRYLESVINGYHDSPA